MNGSPVTTNSKENGTIAGLTSKSGDDGDEGHDERIEKLRDRGQLLDHGIARVEGRYECETRRMQDVEDDDDDDDDEGAEDAVGSSRDNEGDEHEERVREEEEDSDMDIEPDSD
ncbi:uncharacterized protein KY384_008478 [Bacidia gigantensis]|uniref:uncharacterized protein n=1 Tax=Bacidia gigantensis TaxID=2732470 RepID=UPI001D041F05|nr:uncharacterized protein KY384_008478 [Bacidia gigantensis]KAG8527049.1 hypothetical protein KY384_008478 [Bacidia gigantensis]